MNNKFSNREILILNYLRQQQGFVTSLELASYLSVSPRTVKKDLKHLQKIINHQHYFLKSFPGQGYKLDPNYTFGFDELKINRDKDVILNNYDRIAYLVQKLLIAPDFLKYEDLAAELYLSQSTLNRYMVKVKALLATYDLQIIRKPNKGIWVTGSEIKIRLAISEFFYHSFLSYLSNFRQELYYRDDPFLNIATDVIKQEVTKSEVVIDDDNVKDLAIQLKISLTRIKFENRLIFPLNDCSKTDEPLCARILRRISFKQPQLHFDSLTIKYFCLQLTNKKIITSGRIAPPIKQVVQEILNEIKVNFDRDFSNNRLLIKNLELHLMQLTQRVNWGLSLQNYNTFTYFRDYLFAAKISISAAQIMEERLLNCSLPLSEYGCLIVYFQAAILKYPPPSLIIGLYNGNNRAERMLFTNRLKQIIPSSVLIKTLDSVLIKSPAKYDLVISSQKSNFKNFGGPVFYSSNANQLTAEQIKQSLRQSYLDLWNGYISSASILVIDERNQLKIKQRIFEHLQRYKFLKENPVAPLVFYEIGNNLVYIHDLAKIIKKRICLIVILKHPVLWDNTVVKMLFLIKTKKDDDKNLNYLCQTFSTWANNYEELERTYREADSMKLLMQLKRLSLK